MTPWLHVLGCGRVARSLCRLWYQAGVLKPGQVVNRSLLSARDATDFIGAGQPAERLAGMESDDWLLLGLPDGCLEDAVTDLAGSGAGLPALVFHLSGSEDSTVLSPMQVPAASVHPARAFADPTRAAAEFSGTWCVAEGHPAALDLVLPAFETIGGQCLRAETLDKRIYHAATVAASNFAVTLAALAGELAERSGLDPHQGARLLEHLQVQSAGNVARLGPAAALTGPVERGDVATCRKLVEAVDRQGGESARLFRALGQATVTLARARNPKRADWDRMAAVFAGPAATSD